MIFDGVCGVVCDCINCVVCVLLLMCLYLCVVGDVCDGVDDEFK